MALYLLRQVSASIHCPQCYSITADKCTDIANKEQLTICLKWVDDELNDHKDFIGPYQVNSIDANSVVQAIKDTLIQLNLPISACRGQCYDGVLNMSGCKNGAAAQIMADEKQAIFIHCHAHALN